MREKDFSVVTLVKGRRQQLHNLLLSIAASNSQPHDIHIVCMDDTNNVTIPPQLNNVFLHTMKSAQNLPLAHARNTGFQAAQTNNICFVDVDCIVSPTLFASLLADLSDDTIVAAYPRYLSRVPVVSEFATLFPEAVAHPSREVISPHSVINHLKFWSIVFAIRKSSFVSTGGFDEAFIGYGAEDTDFAMSFHAAGLRLIFADDFVLHQYHDKYDPPLNYFSDILQNAQTFHNKWGFYPMERWLHKFAEFGLIEPFDGGAPPVVRRLPTEEDIAACRSTNPY